MRAATVEDLAFVAETAAEVFSPYGDYRELLPQWFRTVGVMTFISEHDGERTGYVMLGFFLDERSLVGDVLAIAVVPGQQGKGIGRMLLQHAITVCEQIAEHTPVRAVRLSVADSNLRAQRLFTSCGFRQLEGDFGCYDGGQKALHLERGLGQAE